MKKEDEIEKMCRMFKRRNEIIRHNNSCIIETISFYEGFILELIIEPFFFNKKYYKYKELKKFLKNRMNFMDRYKIVVEIGKRMGIPNFKNFEFYIKMRNEVAHSLTSMISYNLEIKEGYVNIGDRKISWNDYLNEIKKWSEYSYDTARYIMNVYKAFNDCSDKIVQFHYCEMFGKCILAKKSLILHESDSYDTYFVDEGLNLDLSKYEIEEEQDSD